MKMKKRNENKNEKVSNMLCDKDSSNLIIIDINTVIGNNDKNENENEIQKIVSNENTNENENDSDVTCIFCRENLCISRFSIEKEINTKKITSEKNTTNENVLIPSSNNDNNTENTDDNCNDNENDNNNKEMNDIHGKVNINMDDDNGNLISNTSVPVLQEPVVCLPCVHRYLYIHTFS
jgi:hypothetical protein